MHRNATEEQDHQVKEAITAFSSETLKRIHDDLAGVRRADKDLSGEMNKITVVCEPPPVTPRCHPVELPPNPLMVHISMGNMTRAADTLQKDVDELKPLAYVQSDKFGSHVDDLATQLSQLNVEINKLKVLTGEPDEMHDSERKYDRTAILKETDAIDAMSKAMEKTRKRLEKDQH